jgi:hypothetical protein
VFKPLALISALIVGAPLALALISHDERYWFWIVLESMLLATVAALLLWILRDAFGTWNLDIFFEDKDPVKNSERLWAVALDELSARGLAWNATTEPNRKRWQLKAHDPVILSSEGIRLWFDNSPTLPGSNPTIIRVAFVIEPLVKARDSPRVRQAIGDALLAEENRQRKERLEAARKA